MEDLQTLSLWNVYAEGMEFGERTSLVFRNSPSALRQMQVTDRLWFGVGCRRTIGKGQQHLESGTLLSGLLFGSQALHSEEVLSSLN